jgi:hypothetical protein
MGAVRAIIIALPLCAAAQKPPAPTPFRDVWHLDAGRSSLKSPRAVAVTGDCISWFADADSGVLRLACTARTAAAVGAFGTKDGEYREPWLLAPAGGDSVLLYDRSLERISVYTGEGKVAFTNPVRLSSAGFSELTSLNFGGGTLRAWMSHFPSAADPEALPSNVVRIRADGNTRDTLATLEGISSVYWGSTFTGSHIPVPTARRAVVAFTRDGGFLVGYTNDGRVVVYDSAGRAVRTIELSLPAALAVTKGDRDAYADSVRRFTDAEMDVLHYESAERKQYRSQIETYVKEDAVFPERRQLYDRLVLDASERALWVLLPGTGKNYARTWEVYSMTDGTLTQRVTVPHKGAVVDAAVKDGVLYTVEKALAGAGRVAKYTQ